jgi:hypothetical protein
VTVFSLSLGYSVYLTTVNQPFAYFNTFARLWEFAIGGVLCILLPHIKLNDAIAAVGSWVGLIAIVVCGAVLSVSTIFPGYAALLPTLAAAMIIVAGDTRKPWGADRLLSSKLLTGIGDISYSFYLWHWPILIFYRTYFAESTVGVVPGSAIIAAALCLAWITTRIIEKPIRYAPAVNKSSRSTFLLGAIGCGAVLFAVAAWAGLLSQARSFDRRPISVDDPNYPGALVVDDIVIGESTNNMPYYPGPLGIGSNVPDYVRQKCIPGQECAQVVTCSYGFPDTAVSVAIAGS